MLLIENMPASETLSVQEFLGLYESNRHLYGWVDVRSEGEFEKSSLPGFANLPILNNFERHQVGLTYKQKGQAEAIQLGHELVDPQRTERVNAWKQACTASPSGQGILICWRGGMRSQIAADWARSGGARVSTVRGGFKAIRGELLKTLQDIPELMILSGLTGSGKTDLLKAVQYPKINLEKIAAHRGSSFGKNLAGKQPSQASFENQLYLEIRKSRPKGATPLLVEDESALIGCCFVPTELKLRMDCSNSIWVESSPEERALRIFGEYIEEPLNQGIESMTLLESMTTSLARIKKRLGGLETSNIHRLIVDAFTKSQERGFTSETHEEWISRLLELYYDPMYQYGFKKHVESGRKILFRGTIQECRIWLEQKNQIKSD